MKAFDLVVIGSGPGGYIAAIRAAQLGMKHRDRRGGAEPRRCVPELGLHSDQGDPVVGRDRSRRVKHGVPGLVVEKLAADYGAVIDASRKAADRLVRGVKQPDEEEQDRGRRGTRSPRARPTGDRHEGRRRGGDRGAPRHSRHGLDRVRASPGVAVDGKRVLTSREALESRERPESLVVDRRRRGRPRVRLRRTTRTAPRSRSSR